MKLWLYVAEEFARDWNSGMAVAVASDETEARRLIAKAHGYRPGEYELKRYRLDQRRAFTVSGGG